MWLLSRAMSYQVKRWLRVELVALKESGPIVFCNRARIPVESQATEYMEVTQLRRFVELFAAKLQTALKK
jgi:hypothetical protein